MSDKFLNRKALKESVNVTFCLLLSQPCFSTTADHGSQRGGGASKVRLTKFGTIVKLKDLDRNYAGRGVREKEVQFRNFSCIRF